MTTQSQWHTGTYEMLVGQDPEGREGDLMVTVFAKPVDENNERADLDAPVLSQIDVPREEYPGPLKSWQRGLHDVGREALLTPESLEPIYGPALALRILEALFMAALQDSKGLDGEGRPWRAPSEEAMLMASRAQSVMEVIKGQFMS